MLFLFGLVRDVCLCAITEKPLIRNGCNLVGICAMVPLEVDTFLRCMTLTFDLDSSLRNVRGNLPQLKNYSLDFTNCIVNTPSVVSQSK